MGKLHVERLILGDMRTNCYLAVNEEKKEALIIDPADNAEGITLKLKSLRAVPVAVLLTHGHFDHIGAAEELRKSFGIPVAAMEAEEEVLTDASKNLTGYFGTPYGIKADRYIRDKEQLSYAGFSIRVLHTPGHTSGGACYYIPEEKVLFSGDTLFCESIGRTDFPTGSAAVLRQSVRGLLEELPEDVAVYPGHEMPTDIGHEKQYNPFA